MFADFLRFFYTRADDLFDIDKSFEFLDKELGQVLSGKIDYARTAATIKFSEGGYLLNMSENEGIDKMRDKLQNEIVGRNYAGVIEQFNQVKSTDPETADGLVDMQYNALVHTDPEKTYKMARELIATNDKWQLYVMRVFSETDSLPDEFYALAKNMFEQKAKSSVFCGQPLVMEGLAEAYFHLRETDRAIETEQNWIDFMTRMKASASMMRPFVKRLDKFKAAKIR